MEPLGSVDLESRAVTKRAARGHADLVEQVAGLRALAAAHLVADGDERVSLDWCTGVAESEVDFSRLRQKNKVSKIGRVV